MNDLPPKTVKAQLVRLDDHLKQIERSQVAGIQRAPGSLPVLEAFQQFLETERRKAQQRMLAVSAIALLMIVATAIGGLILVRAQMRGTAADLQQVSSRTDELAVTLAGIEQRGSDDMDALETRFREESRRIVEHYSTLLEEQQAALKGALGAPGTTLETIAERLGRLEAENERLNARWADGTPATVAILPPPMDTGEPATAVPLPMTAADEPGAAAGVEPRLATGTGVPIVIEHPSALLMTIIPGGQERGIRWMLPRRLIRE